MTPEQRLQQLAIELPAPPSEMGAYAASRQAGALLFLSGVLPLVDGKAPFIGRLAKEQAREAARRAALNALALVKQRIGSLAHVKGVVRVAAYIASEVDCTEHAFVADGCSELLNQVFPASGKHARLVLGVPSLPMGMPVALELIFELD
jgi:enamine deaminase RidA (YjgF/YER057c/UK114 family)